MNEDKPKTWIESVEHPSEDDLLCFIDGELAPKSTESIRLHLEACWRCRSRAEKFQGGISLFVDYRNQVFLPIAVDGPANRSSFRAKLENNIIQTSPPPLWKRWLTTFNSFRVNVPAVHQRHVRLATISAATILFVLAGGYFLLIRTAPVVSAEEFINRAVASRENELKNTDQPVLYQQFRIKRRSPQGERSSNVEVWQDIDNLRMRKVVTPVAEDQSYAVLTDLEQILKANKYEPPPLSIVGFRAWRNGLTEKKDSVEETNVDGVAALRLQTETANRIDQNQLIASVLTVRAADYHPLEQVFRVLNNGEVQEFEVRESSFAVMSLNSLNPGFFADSQPMVVQSSPPSKGGVDDASSDGVVVTESVPPAVAGGSLPNVATPELEVEVMNALHSASADLGEQIEVRRAPNGPVTISGVVETPERKTQIINALNAVKDNPAVRIQISTVSEAIAAEKGNKARPQPSVERLQVDTDSYPAEGDLLAHFGDVSKAKNFAARMTGQSSRAMNYLWAMKRLKGQFGTAQVAKLTPEARAKLLNVMRSYAASYQREVATLRRELQPVFGGGGGGQGIRIASDAELLQTIDQLFAAGSGANQVVRTAFMTSAFGTNALKTAQFWQMIARAESLAESIEKYR